MIKLTQALTRNILLAATFSLTGASAESPPEPARLLESVRAAALQYTQKLPNFICEQITHRSTSKLAILDDGTGLVGNPSAIDPQSSLQQDVIEEQLTFVGGHENYSVVSVNGKDATGVNHLDVQGAITTGEFGSLLRDIFDPTTHATIAWDRSVALRGTPAYVIAFRVPSENGRLVIDKKSGQQIKVPYTGKVTVDAGTLDVLEIEARLALPPGFPMKTGELKLEYKPTAIASRNYDLPFSSVVRLEDRSNAYVNRIDFKDYHKFAVESTIHYGNADPQ